MITSAEGRTITSHGRGGGGKNFSVDEFFLVQIICLDFFRRESSARFFFPTAFLLVLKKCKASHSLITELLKVAVSLES